jgi:hypothetical protein
MLKPVFIVGLFTLLATGSGALAGPAPIDLGAASTFAVLAGSAVTNTGSTIVNGDLGVWPSSAVSGFPPGIVMNGIVHAGDAAAMQAQAGLSAAYTAAAGESGAQSLTGQDLGGMTLLPGVYAFASSADLTGTLTLDAAHAANAVFIFQIGSTLTTAANALVQLLDFGAGDQVIWQIGSSATLGSNTVFAGDLLAETSITMGTGASIACGGALALTGAVTLQDSAVSTYGACGAGPSPIPEPATYPVVVAGCIGAALLRLQRKTSRVAA